MNVEFTRTSAPNLDSNTLIGPNATRLLVPTLSIHGAGANTTLLLSVLTPERLEFASIPNYFSGMNFSLVAALLQLLRSASIYELGCNLLFAYSFATPRTNFDIGDGQLEEPAPVTTRRRRIYGAAWKEAISWYHWDRSDIDTHLLYTARRDLWTEPDEHSTIGVSLGIFQSAQDDACVRLVRSLLSLPVHAERNERLKPPNIPRSYRRSRNSWKRPSKLCGLSIRPPFV
ncbi:hypothetical protein C8R43DRAFT_196327 [Mycena crocata]|nr:hypothetical protein C8R43DRAFT_196327 [Mycena crocata]